MTKYHQVSVTTITGDDIAAGRIFHRRIGVLRPAVVKPGDLELIDGCHYLKIADQDDLIRVPVDYLLTRAALDAKTVSRYELRPEHQHVMIHVGELMVDVVRNDHDGLRVSIERDGIEMAHAAVEFASESDRRMIEQTSFSEIGERELRILLLLARIGSSQAEYVDSIVAATDITYDELHLIRERLEAPTEEDIRATLEASYD